MSLESSGDKYIFSMLRLLCFLRLFLSDCPCESQAGNLCILQTQKYINKHRTTFDDSNPFQGGS